MSLFARRSIGKAETPAIKALAAQVRAARETNHFAARIAEVMGAGEHGHRGRLLVRGHPGSVVPVLYTILALWWRSAMGRRLFNFGAVVGTVLLAGCCCASSAPSTQPLRHPRTDVRRRGHRADQPPADAGH